MIYGVYWGALLFLSSQGSEETPLHWYSSIYAISCV